MKTSYIFILQSSFKHLHLGSSLEDDLAK